jgi:sporulation protein YlmC with PRC-barrel domain
MKEIAGGGVVREPIIREAIMSYIESKPAARVTAISVPDVWYAPDRNRARNARMEANRKRLLALAKGHRASKLIGASVTNDKNENVGSIDDIIIDQKRVLFAVLQVGGFLGIGKHLVAIPYESLQISDDGKKIALPGATKDELKNLAEFKYQT